jgi:hypothetical protein
VTVNSKSRWRTGGQKLVEKITKKANLSNWGIIGACKELIFDIADGAPAFHAIMYSLGTSKVSIKLDHLFDILINRDQSAKGLEEDVPTYWSSQQRLMFRYTRTPAT